MSKSPKLSDLKLAQLAGALKRKSTAQRPPAPARVAPKPAVVAAPSKPKKAATPAPQPNAGSGERRGASYEQAVVRVSDSLHTKANMLALDLQEAVRLKTNDYSVTIVPNRVLLVALLRWKQVTQQDRDQIVRSGREDKDAKKHAMWLPLTATTQDHLTKLQTQFVRCGIPIAKTGCNEPAIARQALWRWETITAADVEFYQELCASEAAG